MFYIVLSILLSLLLLSSYLSSWARQEHWLPRNIVGIVVNYISVFPCPSVLVRGWYTSHWETSFRGYGFDHWLHWPSQNQGYIYRVSVSIRVHPWLAHLLLRAPFPSTHSRYIPDTYPTHTRYIRIPHEYPAYTPRILHPKDAYERKGTHFSWTILLARFLCVIFIMYNYYPHSIIMQQPMEIGRGFQHAHNSVKMCAVTHGHSPGGGG